MTERARREYAAALRERYQAADKRGRGQILDEYCRTTGCHRKTAIRRLAPSARPTGQEPGWGGRRALLERALAYGESRGARDPPHYVSRR